MHTVFDVAHPFLLNNMRYLKLSCCLGTVHWSTGLLCYFLTNGSYMYNSRGFPRIPLLDKTPNKRYLGSTTVRNSVIIFRIRGEGIK